MTRNGVAQKVGFLCHLYKHSSRPIPKHRTYQVVMPRATCDQRGLQTRILIHQLDPSFLFNKRCLHFGEENGTNRWHGVLITPWPSPNHYSIMTILNLTILIEEMQNMVNSLMDWFLWKLTTTPTTLTLRKMTNKRLKLEFNRNVV